jgi:hypothetical protein
MFISNNMDELILEQFNLNLDISSFNPLNIISKAKEKALFRDAQKKYNSLIGNYNKVLINNNVDVELIDNYTKEKGKEIAKEIKKGNVKKTSELVKDALVYFFATKFKAENVAPAILTVILVFFMMTFINSILVSYLGAKGFILTTLVVAPIIEQTAKYISIQNGYGTEFLFFFNIAEFTDYVIKLKPILGFAKAAGLRALVVAMHYSTAIIQKVFYDKDIQQGKNEDEAGRSGLFIGILVHGLWNGLAVLAEKGIRGA